MSTPYPHADLRNKSESTGGGVNRFPNEDTKEILRSWLVENERTLLAQKNVGEFNGVMMQWFHWYTDDDGNHWKRLKAEAEAEKERIKQIEKRRRHVQKRFNY